MERTTCSTSKYNITWARKCVSGASLLVGLMHVFVLYSGFTLAVGTLALSKFLAGSLYDAHLDALSDDPFTCYGASCFRTTHLVVAGLSLTSVGAGMACEYLSRKAYKHQQQPR